MKILAIAAAFMMLTACSQDSASPTTPESLATAYIDSLFQQDTSAMQQLVRSGSQAESSWEQRRAKIAKLRSGSGVIGYRTRSCVHHAEKPRCEFVVTKDSSDAWALVVHVRQDAMGRFKVEDALVGR